MTIASIKTGNTSVHPEQKAPIEHKTKKPEGKTDSLSSAATAPAATKSFCQKVKDFFVSIYEWLKAKICCQSKKEKGSETKTEGSKSKTETKVLDISQEVKKLDERKNEIFDAIKKVKELSSDEKNDEVVIKIIKNLFPTEVNCGHDACEKQASAISRCDELLIQILKKKRESFSDAVDAIAKNIQKLTQGNGLSIFYHIEDDTKLSNDQKVQAFKTILSPIRAVILQAYKVANSKSDFTEEKFIALMKEKPTDPSFEKMFDERMSNILDSVTEVEKMLKEILGKEATNTKS